MLHNSSHNSEYPATLRSAQIGSRWSPTSCTRGTIHEQFTALQRQMDERFSSQETHFTTLQKQIDERFTAQERHFDDVNQRFDDMNRRFDKQHTLISLGFAAITLIIAAFNLTLILS